MLSISYTHSFFVCRVSAFFLILNGLNISIHITVYAILIYRLFSLYFNRKILKSLYFYCWLLKNTFLIHINIHVEEKYAFLKMSLLQIQWLKDINVQRLCQYHEILVFRVHKYIFFNWKLFHKTLEAFDPYPKAILSIF